MSAKRFPFPTRRDLGGLCLALVLVGTAAPGAAQPGPCDAEHEAARTLAARIEDEWPTRSRLDPAAKYLQDLARRLAAPSPAAAAVPWRLTLVRDLGINAFSIGAGRIYLTEGAVLLTRNEAELAAILAHEMGHELAGHLCRRKPGFWHTIIDPFRPGRGPDASSQARVGSFTQEVDPVKEREADRLAIGLMTAAGHNPHAMLDLVERLPAGASHLQDRRRIDTLKSLLSSLPNEPRAASPGYAQAKALLQQQH